MLTIVAALLMHSAALESMPSLRPSDGQAPKMYPWRAEPPQVEETDPLQLQLADLRGRRDRIHFLPPLLLMGAGAVVFAVSALVWSANLCSAPENCTSNPDLLDASTVGGVTGLVMIAIGLVWCIVDLIIRDNLSGQLDDLKAEIDPELSNGSGVWHHPGAAPLVSASRLPLSLRF